MKSIKELAGKAAVVALAGLVAGLAAPTTAAAADAYESFVMNMPAEPSWETAGDYGSQGYHHGLPPAGAIGAVEPVAGGAEAMRAASLFGYEADPDYGSRKIEHWLPSYWAD
jgi:hypothetical protein